MKFFCNLYKVILQSYQIYLYIFRLLGQHQESWPLVEIGSWITISRSSCSFYACSETIMNLDRCAQTKRKIFWFPVKRPDIRSLLTENTRALGMRLVLRNISKWYLQGNKHFNLLAMAYFTDRVCFIYVLALGIHSKFKPYTISPFLFFTDFLSNSQSVLGRR